MKSSASSSHTYPKLSSSTILYSYGFPHEVAAILSFNEAFLFKGTYIVSSIPKGLYISFSTYSSSFSPVTASTIKPKVIKLKSLYFLSVPVSYSSGKSHINFNSSSGVDA